MCGRFATTITAEELNRRFGVTVLQNLRPRWNVAPSQPVVVITRNGLHDEASQANWGLPPSSKGRSFLINARMETVQEKPTFSTAFTLSRCIIPASGWYEWSAPKTPWHIQLGDGGVMAMAGLMFKTDGGSRFVIITSAATGGVAEIHHRQPLVLPNGCEESWLGGTLDQALALCQPAPASWFNWYRVSSEVGRVAADHPELVTPLEGDDVKVSTSGQADLFG